MRGKSPKSRVQLCACAYERAKNDIAEKKKCDAPCRKRRKWLAPALGPCSSAFCGLLIKKHRQPSMSGLKAMQCRSGRPRFPVIMQGLVATLIVDGRGTLQIHLHAPVLADDGLSLLPTLAPVMQCRLPESEAGSRAPAQRHSRWLYSREECSHRGSHADGRLMHTLDGVECARRPTIQPLIC